MAVSLFLPFLLNALSLLCILSGAYFALSFHRKPVLAWDVPLHLSYQDLGSVGHSRGLARYDAELWNRVAYACGGLVAAMTLVAFQRQRHYHPRRPFLRQARGTTASDSFGVDVVGLGVLMLAACIGAEVSSALLGMHTATWTATSPIRQVATAAITDELTRAPAATPWDIGSVMLRSAFERTVYQNGHGALEVISRYLARHLRAEGVQVGTTVYPSIRTHGVGVAPVPWTRRGYQVSPAYGRVLWYSPIVAGTNVTVSCSDSSEDWTWRHDTTELAPTEQPCQQVHRFQVAPKTDWNTRGPNHTVTYVEGTSKGINLETWLAMRKSSESHDTQLHQIFLFTSVGALDGQPKVTVIQCAYGGFDLVRQVTMTSPLEPIVLGDVLAIKNALSLEDLWPAAEAIDEALGGDGGMMLAGMAAAKMTSFATWDLFRGRTLELPALIEHILVDTAQAYFSLVRQWKEEAQFFSWPGEFPNGDLTGTTRRLGRDGIGGLGGLIVLGLLAVLPLTALARLSRSALRRRDFSEKYELKDGVIKKKYE